FMHSAAGEYSLPHSYTFVAPRGVARAVQQFIAHPERFRSAFLERWNTDIAGKLVEKQILQLSPEIEATIKTFDFTQLYWLDAAQLVEDPACKPALVKWFDEDPGPSPRGVVPDEIDASESSYI